MYGDFINRVVLLVLLVVGVEVIFLIFEYLFYKWNMLDLVVENLREKYKGYEVGI